MNRSSKLLCLAFSLIGFLAIWELPGQNGPFQLYLIGDCGKYPYIEDNPVLLGLREELTAASENSAVLFLGDNIYNSGLEEGKNYELNRAKLGTQLATIRNFNGYSFFVSGNHDWQTGKKEGLKVIRHQAEYVNQFVKDSTPARNRSFGAFFPKEAGTPGPDTFRVAPHVLVLMYDSQWFIHRVVGQEVGTQNSRSADEEETLFWDTLSDILSKAHKKGDKVVIAAHHPVFTIGPHGKKGGGLDFANLIPRYNSQELYGKGYKRLKRRMELLLTAFPKTVIYVAGHDHNLQYWRDKVGNRQVVSGAGSKLSEYYPRAQHLYWNQNATLVFPNEERYPGFEDEKIIPEEDLNRGWFRLEFQPDGTVEVFVKELGRPELKLE